MRGRRGTRLEAPVLVPQRVIQDPALHISVVRVDRGPAIVEDGSPSAGAAERCKEAQDKSGLHAAVQMGSAMPNRVPIAWGVPHFVECE